MEFNEFREKVKEALPDFLTDDLRNAEIKDTAVNKLQEKEKPDPDDEYPDDEEEYLIPDDFEDREDEDDD